MLLPLPLRPGAELYIRRMKLSELADLKKEQDAAARAAAGTAQPDLERRAARAGDRGERAGTSLCTCL